MNTIRLVNKNHAIPDRKIMKKHMKNPFIFVITSLILMTGSLVQGQQPLSIPVPLPPPGVELPLHEPGKETHEPERWTQEDITLEEQFSTAKKETMAAYQVALDECKGLPTAEFQTCVSQAKSEMEKEMAKIRRLFGLPN